MTDNAADNLMGIRLEGGWVVTEKVLKPAGHSGGAFSVSYIAVGSDGQKAFVKAFDYAAALALPDPADELNHLTAVYNFEKNLLQLCGRRQLSRVVRVLQAGAARVEGFSPSVVNYLVLEHADAGDARDYMSTIDPAAEQSGQLRLAHHATVALRQLHSIGVAHQDVKPSNLLVWGSGVEANKAKLGDLGCAHSASISSPYDPYFAVGDQTYAAPEIAYGSPDRVSLASRRYASDLFGLGNLICYLLTSVPYNAILQGHLDQSQRAANFDGRFEDVLTGLIDAHGQAMRRVGSALHISLADGVQTILYDLCHPDPIRRGDQIGRTRGRNQYSLDRFVTNLDLAVKRSEIGARSRTA